MEGLKEKVQELRRKKGWTQEELAQEMRVTLSTVQRWEKKGVKPNHLARREIIRLLSEARLYDDEV